MTPRLHRAIEDAYRVFGTHRLGESLEVCHCPCCMTQTTAQSILSTPLRDLTNEQLSEYTNSAHGWSDQFLHLLPRYMELISQGERPSDLFPEHILSRFRYAPENCMTASETAALTEWLTALFEDTLCRPISSEELACALAWQNQPSWEGFGRDICEVIQIALPTPFDTSQFRMLWEECEVREANLRLASAIYFGIGAQRFHKDKLLPQVVSEASAQWHDWFAFRDHTNKLIEAFERETDPRGKEFLLLAI